MERAKHVSEIGHKRVKFKYPLADRLVPRPRIDRTELKHKDCQSPCYAIVDIDISECVFDTFRSVPDTRIKRSKSPRPAPVSKIYNGGIR